VHFSSLYVPRDPPIFPSVIFISRIIFGEFLMCEVNFHLLYAMWGWMFLRRQMWRLLRCASDELWWTADVLVGICERSLREALRGSFSVQSELLPLRWRRSLLDPPALQHTGNISQLTFLLCLFSNHISTTPVQNVRSGSGAQPISLSDDRPSIPRSWGVMLSTYLIQCRN